MKLYELTEEERNLNELFLQSVDSETGEIIDSETLEVLEKDFQKQLATKAEGIVKVLREQKVDIERVEAEIERLEGIKKRLKKYHENFKKYIKYNMTQLDKKKIETPLGNLTLTQTTATEIYDEEIIPKEFLKEKVTYSVSKTDVKKALQEGKEVAGARLIMNTSLNIK